MICEKVRICNLDIDDIIDTIHYLLLVDKLEKDKKEGD